MPGQAELLLKRAGRQPSKLRGNVFPWEVAAAAVLGVLAALLPQAHAQVLIDLPTRLQLVQAAGAQGPRIAVLSTIVAEPSSRTPLQIRIGPTDAIPRNSFLQLRGLPTTASLSEGHAIAPGSWAVPLVGLPALTVYLPPTLSGRSDLVISLVGENGALLAEARMVLVIQPPSQPAAAESKGAEPRPPAARPKAPVLTPEDRANAERLVARGVRDLEQGNIAQARQFFLRAAQAGLAQGALKLGATYDPHELARMHAVGVQPNPAEARKWYERARELGASEASDRLAALGGGG